MISIIRIDRFRARYFSIQRVREPDQTQVQVEQESGQVCVCRRPAQLTNRVPRRSPLSSGCHDRYRPTISTRRGCLLFTSLPYYQRFSKLQYAGITASIFPGSHDHIIETSKRSKDMREIEFLHFEIGRPKQLYSDFFGS